MSRRGLWVLLALLVLTRAVLVLSMADVHGYGEELGKGAAAKALLDHLPVSTYQLVYGYHEGGGFVVTVLKALAFLLVGPSVLAHKLVALSTSALILAVAWRSAREHFGLGAAWTLGLGFVFAPDAFLRFSLLSLGTHFEALVFLTLVMQFALRIVRASSDAGSQSWDWAKLGLAAGFGLYFSLLSVAASAWAGLALLLFARREIVLRHLAALAGGVLVGALPLWWMMSHVGLDALFVRGHEGKVGGKVERWTALGDLFVAWKQGDAGAWVLAAAYVLAIGAGAGFIARDATRRRAALVVATFVPFFALLYLASGMAIRPESGWFFQLRLAPLWFFGLATFAACAGAAWENGRRALAATACAALVAVGAWDLAGLAADGRPGSPADNARVLATTKGYDYSEYIDKVLSHLDGDLEAKIAVLRHFRDDPELLLPEIEFSSFEHAELPLPAALATTRRAFGDEWPVAAKGLRFFVHPNFGHDMPAAFAAIETVDEDARQPLAEAIGRAGLGPRLRVDKLQQQLELAIDPRYRTSFLRGAGWRIYQTFRLRPDLAREFLEPQPPERKVMLVEGYTEALTANRVAR